MKTTLTLFISIFLFGCATFSSKYCFSVVLDESSAFEYTGRGQGAGVALISTMGPVGIAVGVAIDEGIRKDLEAAANEAGFDIIELVKNSSAIEELGLTEVTIVSYGMRDVRGEETMFPFIELSVVSDKSKESVLLEYNPHFEVNSKSLNEYRNDGSLIVFDFKTLLNQSF